MVACEAMMTDSQRSGGGGSAPCIGVRTPCKAARRAAGARQLLVMKAGALERCRCWWPLPTCQHPRVWPRGPGRAGCLERGSAVCAYGCTHWFTAVWVHACTGCRGLGRSGPARDSKCGYCRLTPRLQQGGEGKGVKQQRRKSTVAAAHGRRALAQKERRASGGARQRRAQRGAGAGAVHPLTCAAPRAGCARATWRRRRSR